MVSNYQQTRLPSNEVRIKCCELTAGNIQQGAVNRRNPKVARASVEDHSEDLRRRAYANVSVVLSLERERERENVCGVVCVLVCVCVCVCVLKKICATFRTLPNAMAALRYQQRYVMKPEKLDVHMPIATTNL